MSGDGCATTAEIVKAYPELNRDEIARAVDSLAFEGMIVRCSYHAENYIITPKGLRKYASDERRMKR